MKKLLLHTCCAPCLVYVYDILKLKFEITVYFYNPNIYPESEYLKRLNELKEFCSKQNIKIVIQNPDTDYFYERVNQFKYLGEKSQRCFECYEMRLEKTAEVAKSNNFDVFSTTLSISPHKIADKINEKGHLCSKKFGIEFFEADFKKENGFLKSCELSKKHNFYRQNYCGCIFSLKEREKRIKK